MIRKQELGAKLNAAEAGLAQYKNNPAKGKRGGDNQLRLFGFHGSGRNAAKLVAAVVAVSVIGFNE